MQDCPTLADAIKAQISIADYKAASLEHYPTAPIRIFAARPTAR